MKALLISLVCLMALSFSAFANQDRQQREQTQEGDDFYFRLGILLAEDRESNNLESFDSPLIDLLSKSLNKNTDQEYFNGNMVMFVDQAHTMLGVSWKNPYMPKNITMVPIAPTEEKDGWRQIEIDLNTYKKEISKLCFGKKCKISGLWLMPDGDNTEAVFGTSIRNIKIIK